MHIKDTLVELDIINTPEVQEIRSHGVLSPVDDEQSEVRTKRAATNIRQWPNKRVPYTFHWSVSKFAVKFET